MSPPYRPTQRIDGRIVHENPYFRVHEDRVEFHSGRPGTYWKMDYRRVGVGVLPVLADGRMLLGLHHRYCPDVWGWEIAAGGAEVGEDFVITARRELHEETGREAEHLHFLLDFCAAPGLGNERFISYVATGLSEEAAHPDVEEIYELRAFTWSEVESAIAAREIVCGFTLTTLFAARVKGLV